MTRLTRWMTRLVASAAVTGALITGLSLWSGPLTAQGTALSFTTFSSAMADTSGTVAVLASTTGVSAPTTSTSTMIYADGELMGVRAVTGSNVTVTRGVGGTRATTHPANGFVYVGPPTAFITYDPNGSCTPANYLNLPVVNVRNGNIYHCQTTTSGSAWMAWNTTPVMETKPRTVVAGVAYTILPTDYTVVMSTTLTGSGGVGVAVKSFTLPSHLGLAGKQLVIKDESGGLTATTNIVLVGTIDGTNSATATVIQMKTAFQSVGLEAGSGGWFTLWCQPASRDATAASATLSAACR